MTCESNVFELAEGPLYFHNKWFWVDIPTGKLFSATSDINRQRLEKKFLHHISNIVGTDSESILISADNRLILFDTQLNSTQDLVSLPIGPTHRCNDGSVGPDGKFWFGTMEKTPTGLNGRIYSFDSSGNLIDQNAAIGIPNSFIWLNSTEVLITDSFLKVTFKVSLLNSGKLDWPNREIWLDMSGTNCTPDGGVLDADSNVWLAIWGGAAIHKYSPNGEMIDKIALEALQPTSCTFGGINMDELLVTTATEGLSEQKLRAFPKSGKIMRCQVGIKGLHQPVFKLNG